MTSFAHSIAHSPSASRSALLHAHKHFSDAAVTVTAAKGTEGRVIYSKPDRAIPRSLSPPRFNQNELSPLAFLPGLGQELCCGGGDLSRSTGALAATSTLALCYILALEETWTSNEEPGHHRRCCALLGVSLQGNPDTTVTQ